MSNNHTFRSSRAIVALSALIAALAPSVGAQTVVQGPSSSRTPYLVPSAPNAGVVRNITSLVTTLDLVPLTGAPATPFEICGILDGLGAYDNGDGTVTVLANHEINTTVGAVRRHGARGTFVTELIVDKQTLAVVSAQDLIHTFVLNGVDRNVVNGNPIALGRFCSSDLPELSAFFNSASGLGTTSRIYLTGEEGPATGYAVAAVATGTEKGRAYILPKFNVATSGVGGTAVGGWENMLASPFAQDLTVVASTNDGGTGTMNNTVNIYIGQKQAAGNEVERAGLTNGTSYFVEVVGNPNEIVNTTTRATNITSGTRFNLVAFSATSTGTRFSRPEDGAWDPTSPRDFYFVTTDRLDTTTATGFNQTTGASGSVQTGMSRLWRMRFDDITNPLAGGVIDLVINGSKNNQKVNMLDNMAVGGDGMVYLTEDPGNSTYLGKSWAYDPATDTLVQLAKFDSARWGELAVNGGTPGALAPYTNDKEISGVIDVTSMFPHAADEQVLLIDVQDHSTNPGVANPNTVEGGQLLLFRVSLRARTEAFGAACGLGLASAASSRPVLGGSLTSDVTGIATGAVAFMMVGGSNTTFLGAPLPLDLGILGVPGCFLLQDLALEGAGGLTVTGAGTASYALPIPSSFSFTGFTVYLQAWSSATQLSNGLKVVLGL
ncbi:MAG: hypothetical protein MUC36_22545 [Planctomycetes bacterium]|jgi:hypothetical protein|nr:hypothetical protein [Planctomycetota bacterium]